MAPWELHPSLVHFPIAFLLGAVLLDLVAWFRASASLSHAATWLFIAGVATDLLAMAAGVLAFFTVPAHTEEAHVMMYWHLSLAVIAFALFSCVAIARWRRRAESPSSLSRAAGMVAACLILIVGYLGGHMVYRGGAGIQPSLLAANVQQAHQHGAAGHQESAGSDQASHQGHASEAKPGASDRPAHQAHETKRAPEQLPTIPVPDAAAAQVPAGYRVEIVMSELTYPTSIEFGDDGAMYVAEAGYNYGDDVAQARILRRLSDGGTETIADRLEGPVTDLLWHDKRLYISHRGKISVLEAGGVRDLVTGLPSLGDHHNNQFAVGPDGKLYFGQGTATNSGVVGIDSFKMGWLSKYPEVCDVPAKDIRVSDQAFETADPLTLLADRPQSREDKAEGPGAHQQDARGAQGKGQSSNAGHEGHGPQQRAGSQADRPKSPQGAGDHANHAGGQNKGPKQEGPEAKPEQKEGHQAHEMKSGPEEGSHRMAKTFAFQPFGKTPPDDGALRGAIKANGTILRMNADGSDLEVFAWGLRNPFGLVWGTDNKLYASDNGYDERGSRPIAHAPDLLWEIKQDAWYGFPDFAGGVPVTDERFRPENGPVPKFLMRDHPPVEKPAITLTHHVAAAKLAVSRNDAFGFQGQLFLALAGDMNPITGMHDERSGFEVVRIEPGATRPESFFKAKQEALGPRGMEYVATAGPRRPVDVQFSRDGTSLYVVDVGAMAVVDTAVGPVPRPFPRTGVVWRIARQGNLISAGH